MRPVQELTAISAGSAYVLPLETPDKRAKLEMVRGESDGGS
jgi:hypothetical protein